MYSEARKLHLVEEVLKIRGENILIELEDILKKPKQPEKKPRFSAHGITGVWSQKDAGLISDAIEEGCEQIHPDDWR